MESPNGTNANNSDSSAPMPESGWELFLKLVWKIIYYFSPPWWLTALVLVYAFGSVYAYFRHIKMKQSCAGWRTTILLTRMALTGFRKGVKGIKRTFLALKNFVVFGIPGCVLFLFSGCLFMYTFLRNLLCKPEETGNGTWLSDEFVLSAATHGYLSSKDEFALQAMKAVTERVPLDPKKAELAEQNKRVEEVMTGVLDVIKRKKVKADKRDKKDRTSKTEPIPEIQITSVAQAETGKPKKQSGKKRERGSKSETRREYKKLRKQYKELKKAMGKRKHDELSSSDDSSSESERQSANASDSSSSSDSE